MFTGLSWGVGVVRALGAVLLIGAIVAPPSPALAAVTFNGNVTPNPNTTTIAMDQYVGYSQPGDMTVDGGSNIVCSHGFIGNDATATGSATITGAGSTWSCTGNLSIGLNGSGTLNINSGGAVSNVLGLIGWGTLSHGQVNVSAGSTWTCTGNTYVGLSGSASLSILTGGTVRIGGSKLVIANSTGSSGQLYLSGGTLDLQNHNIQAGSGAWLFSFTGGRLANPATVTLGPTFTQSAGTLAPGATTIAGAYTLGSGGTLEIELAGAGGVPGVDLDRLTVQGAATLAGILDVKTIGSYVPQAGQTFDVLTATAIDADNLTWPATSAFTGQIVPGGSGQILRLTAVPEPHTLWLGIAGALILRRRGC